MPDGIKPPEIADQLGIPAGVVEARSGLLGGLGSLARQASGALGMLPKPEISLSPTTLAVAAGGVLALSAASERVISVASASGGKEKIGATSKRFTKEETARREAKAAALMERCDESAYVSMGSAGSYKKKTPHIEAVIKRPDGRVRFEVKWKNAKYCGFLVTNGEGAIFFPKLRKTKKPNGGYYEVKRGDYQAAMFFANVK